MINVLHIIKSLGRGGAEMLLPETMNLNNKKMFNFHIVYFLPWKDQMVSAIEEAGGEVVCMNKTNNWQILNSAKEVSGYCRKHDIHIIHAHLPWAGFLARRVGRKTNLPVIYSEHNKQERYHFLTKWINKFTFNNQSLVIAVSEDVALSINKNINPNVLVQIVLNGVNTQKFNREKFIELGKEIKTKLNIPEGDVVIGTVAVFRTQKRLDIWVEMAARLINGHANMHFIMLGDGPMEELIREKIKEHKLENRFHLPGRLEEVRPWLAAMDIYMMTSEFEGLPIALLEAMSMELPVVSTDAGGIKEVISNGEEGYIVPVEEPSKLLKPVLVLVKDELKRKVMGKKGRERVKDKFSMERMVSELEEVYQEVLANLATHQLNK